MENNKKYIIFYKNVYNGDIKYISGIFEGNIEDITLSLPREEDCSLNFTLYEGDVPSSKICNEASHIVEENLIYFKDVPEITPSEKYDVVKANYYNCYVLCKKNCRPKYYHYSESYYNPKILNTVKKEVESVKKNDVQIIQYGYFKPHYRYGVDSIEDINKINFEYFQIVSKELLKKAKYICDTYNEEQKCDHDFKITKYYLKNLEDNYSALMYTNELICRKCNKNRADLISKDRFAYNESIIKVAEYK